MSGIRYRKNVDCLTDEELHDIREAFAKMYLLPVGDANSFARQASFHGGPPTSYCRHGAPGFFTWHRAYLMAFEGALRSVGCEVMVPFWDWSSGPSTGVPAACREATYVNRSGATVSNPLYAGPRPAGGQTSRRGDIDTTSYDDLAAGAQAAMAATTFSSFQNQINGVHGGVHVRTAGDMGFVPTASYDPIFYLHHATVDRLWARWQATHPGSLPIDEATFALQPFSRPFSVQWQTGSDVESTDALGYRYRTFCFWLPPIRLWEAIEISLAPWIRERMTSARLLVKSVDMQSQPLEIRAFIDQPRAAATSKIIGNAAFAGAVGFVGHAGLSDRSDDDPIHCPECALRGDTMEHMHHLGALAAPRSEGERFDVELDITNALRKVDGDSDKVALKLIAIGMNGDEIAADEVLLDEIELIVE